MFIEQFLGGNKMAPQKIHNGGYHAHAQVLNAYNCCLTVCRGQQDGTIKIFTMVDIMRMRKF